MRPKAFLVSHNEMAWISGLLYILALAEHRPGDELVVTLSLEHAVGSFYNNLRCCIMVCAEMLRVH